MEELKQAYETLELPEDASREQVEQRYLMLLKKSKSGKMNLDEINKAYNKIVGYESSKAAIVEKQSKTAHFFYYYKYHVLVALIVLIVAGVTIKGTIDRRIEEANKPPLDLTVTLFGNYFSVNDSESKLSQNLLSLVPEWKRIDVNLVYMPKELRSQQDMALNQKGMLTIMTEKMDLMILDEKNFEMLAKQHAFAALDSLDIWPDLQKDQQHLRSALVEEETSAHPYGVDITGHPLLKDAQIDSAGERYILAMRNEPAHPEPSLRMLKLLTMPK